MNKLVSKSFIRNHLIDIDLDELDLGLLSSCLGSNYRLRLVQLAEASLSRTLMVDGQVIAVVGVQVMWRGVGEAWLVPSVHLKKYTLSVVKMIKSYLDIMDAQERFVRIQTIVRSQECKFKNFAKLFGFKSEGILSKFEPDGTDAEMMGRVA